MAGQIGWRLLVAFSLILVVSAALRGQGVQVTRSDLFAPGFVAHSQSDLAPMRLPPAGGVGGSPVLHLVPRMIQSSGIIFSGQVVSVKRSDSAPGQQSTPTVITFQVKHGIRGAVDGQRLTIREWPGLWNRGERYRVGEHVFLFLYPPSRLGLTSPVAGPLGRLAMDSRDRVLIPPETASVFAPDLVFEGKDAVRFADFQQALQRIGYEK